MAVITDRASAVRLVAEGAICFDTDTSIATRDGIPVPLPSGPRERTCPILVCGSSDRAVRAAAERLERQGLAAWQVTGGGRDGVADGQASAVISAGAGGGGGGGALSRAE